MSIMGIGTNHVASSLSASNSYFAERNADARQLAKSLKAGDLDGAEQAFNSLTSLGQLPGVNSTTSVPFSNPMVATDFQAIGQALQNGDVTAAQRAFQTLQMDFQANRVVYPETVEKVSPAGGDASGTNSVSLLA
jgi:hypothetical protein